MKVSEYIHQVAPLTLEEKLEVEKAFTDLTLPKGGFFAQEGKVNRHLGFILSGRLRNYYYDENAVEKTCFFCSCQYLHRGLHQLYYLSPFFRKH